MKTPDDFKIKLRVSLPLTPDHQERSTNWLRAYAEVAQFADEAIVTIPAWQEFDDSPSPELLDRTVQELHAHGVPFSLAADLWIRWRNVERQRHDDVTNPAYYAAYIARLKGNAKRLGAVGTSAYGEPLGGSIFSKEWFKRAGIEPVLRGFVKRAIASATQVAGTLDTVYPHGSGSADHYGWALEGLGIEALCGKTYRARKVGDLKVGHLKVNAPADTPFRLNWWGTWVSLKPDQYGLNPPPLTPEEFHEIDFVAVQAEYPGLNGAWIYVDSHEWMETVYALARLGR